MKVLVITDKSSKPMLLVDAASYMNVPEAAIIDAIESGKPIKHIGIDVYFDELLES